MIRILGDRASLLAALTAHWADQSLGLSTPPSTPQLRQRRQLIKTARPDGRPRGRGSVGQ